MTASGTAPYYDPYDFEIDADPYPVWRRLRDEAPLYYNERHDFYALSRFDDVERCLIDWRTYRSGRGSVLEIIKSGQEAGLVRSSWSPRIAKPCRGPESRTDLERPWLTPIADAQSPERGIVERQVLASHPWRS